MKRRTWTDVAGENPWLVPFVGAVSIIVALLVAGWIWALFELYILLFAGLVAWDRSRRIRRARAAQEPEEEEDLVKETLNPMGEPWDRAADEGELSEVTDTDQEASALREPSPPSTPAGPSKLVRLAKSGPPRRKETFPVLEAFVAATASDAAGVRQALEAWVKQPTNPDRRKERQAQLHYWLYRSGDAQELEALKALAAANPQLPEIGVFLHLAQQEYDELWS